MSPVNVKSRLYDNFGFHSRPQNNDMTIMLDAVVAGLKVSGILLCRVAFLISAEADDLVAGKESNQSTS